jgi:hypothetical protein
MGGGAGECDGLALLHGGAQWHIDTGQVPVLRVLAVVVLDEDLLAEHVVPARRDHGAAGGCSYGGEAGGQGAAVGREYGDRGRLLRVRAVRCLSRRRAAGIGVGGAVERQLQSDRQQVRVVAYDGLVVLIELLRAALDALFLRDGGQRVAGGDGVGITVTGQSIGGAGSDERRRERRPDDGGAADELRVVAWGRGTRCRPTADIKVAPYSERLRGELSGSGWRVARPWFSRLHPKPPGYALSRSAQVGPPLLPAVW